MVNAARAFKERSSHGVVDKCVGALDGLFIRVIRPIREETAEPNFYYSGDKKAFRMNCQVYTMLFPMIKMHIVLRRIRQVNFLPLLACGYVVFCRTGKLCER